MEIKPSYIKIILLIVLNISGVLCFGQSYNVPLSTAINKTTNIKLYFLKRKNSVQITSRNSLSFFKHDIQKSRNKVELHCDSTVKLVYLHKTMPLLTVYYSSSVTGSYYKAAAISFEVNHVKVVSEVTYNMGMIIDELYYKTQH